MRKFWEQFNHLERTLQAILALLAFALAVIFASVAAYLSVGIFNNPDNWQNQFIIPFTCISPPAALVISACAFGREVKIYTARRGVAINRLRS